LTGPVECPFFFLVFFLFKKCIHLRERERARAGGGAEGEREDP